MTEHVDNIIEAIKAQAQAYQLLKAEMIADGVDVTAHDMDTWFGPLETGWQPIETAPEDGTQVLSYGEEGHSIVDYFQGAWYDSAREIIQPTHWMPLPNPPEDV